MTCNIFASMDARVIRRAWHGHDPERPVVVWRMVKALVILEFWVRARSLHFMVIMPQ